MLTPSLANDAPSFYHTNGLWTGTNSTPLCPLNGGAILGAAGTANTLNAGWVTVQHSAPYTALQVLGPSHNTGTTNGVCGRIVSVGVRVQYTGTLMNESGVYYCYHDVSHTSLSGASISNLGNFADVDVRGVTRMPCSLVAHGVSNSELNFSTDQNDPNSYSGMCEMLYPYANSDNRWASTQYLGSASIVGGIVPPSLGTYCTPLGTPIGAIGFTGVAGQTIHVEFTFNAEYAGMAASSSLTESMSDPVAADRVRTAALKLPRMKLDAPENTTAWSLMRTALSSVWNETKQYVVPATVSAVAAML